MLHKCRRDQWHIDDLDWGLTPPRMDRDKEIAVVQHVTDMAGIVRRMLLPEPAATGRYRW